MDVMTRGVLPRTLLVLVCVLGVCLACTSGTAPPPSSPSSSGPSSVSADPAKADAVMKVVEDARAEAHLKAVIVRVTIDGKEIATRAVGDSMPGVPATTDMHFRNGAVAISYVATALLQLVDEKKVSLDDKVSTWLPDIPYTDKVTLGQLAQMTSGYVDYVTTPELDDAQYANPFRTVTPEDLIAISTRHPLLYEPGTNWNYSHTNYVILGLALEKITGQDVASLLRQKVLGPLGLDDTTDPGTPAIPEPALHAYTSERRQALKIPAGTPFYEDSTYWNPSWTITHGAIQTTDIHDLNATAVAMGTGTLLSPESHQKMLTKDLIGKTTTLPGCTTCHPQSPGYTYGLGIISSGNWVLQNPLFSGEAGAYAYLPSQKVAIAVAVTFDQAAFDPTTGDYKNSADVLWRRIAATLVPGDAPPMPPGS
ncbi:serine hydrolase domain-containing protein [Pseudonocardia sp. NPDC049154]|uniref:serine hydrolase domain-containing protein n=1 Tax=Pseudonocardia sp. NPDC049154 TaxID=3155501 RepID=UPI0033FF4B9F